MLYHFCFLPVLEESEIKPANKYGSGNHWRKIEDGYDTKTNICRNAYKYNTFVCTLEGTNNYVN
jgi:hypothetical protein